MATRHERVVLELEDNFTTKMAQAAASTAVLKGELESLSKSSVRGSSTTKQVERDIDKLGQTASKTSKDMKDVNGGVGVLVESLTVLTPALVGLSAVGVAGISGIASELGFAATGVGTLLLAFHGLGDVLKVVNTAQLQPTAKNLKAAQVAMAGLSPQTRAFVKELVSMEPELKKLQETAREGIFPGFTQGLKSAQTEMPKVTELVKAISTEVGAIGADVGGSLASGRWDAFLAFLTKEGPSALNDMATATGNTAHALANLWMATTPINEGFSTWLVNATADLDKWAAGLDKTQGFQDFVAYLDKTGPQVVETLGALSNAVLQIAEATAPLAGPVFKGIEALSNLIAHIANSNLGTPIFGAVAAMILYNRAMQAAQSLNKSVFGASGTAGIKEQSVAVRSLAADIGILRQQTTEAARAGIIGPLTKDQTTNAAAVDAAQSRVKTMAMNIGKTTSLVAGLALASSGAADKIGLANTASLAWAGNFVGGALGAGLGAGAGFILDIKNAADHAKDSLEGLDTLIANGSLPELQAKLAQLQGQVASQNISSPGDVAGLIVNPLKLKNVATSEFTGAFDAQSAAVDALQFRIHNLNLALAGVVPQSLPSLLTQSLGGSMHEAALQTDLAAASALKFTNQLTSMNEKLSQSNALIAARDAVRGLRNAVQSNPTGRNFNSQTSAGDAVKSALNSAVSATLTAASGFKDPSAELKFLNDMHDSIVNQARALGLPIAAVQGLLKQYGILGRTKVAPQVDSSSAKNALRAVKGDLEDLIVGQHTITVNANTKPAQDSFSTFLHSITGKTVTVGVKTGKAGGIGGLLGQTGADGATIEGPRYPYGDKVLFLGAPGEEVITNRNGEADQFRADRAAGRIPHYANGGTVGGPGVVPIEALPPKKSRKKRGAATTRALRALNKALADSKAAITKETAQRSALITKQTALINQRDQLSSTVSSAFTSDLWQPAAPGSVWLSNQARQSAGVGDVFSILSGDIRNATASEAALKTLKAKGLHGQAFASLAGSGNLQAEQAFAQLSKAQIAKFEALFDQRAAVTNALGSYTGNVVYGAQIAALNKQVAAANRQVEILKRIETLAKTNPHLAALELAKAINGAAATPVKRGAHR